MGGCHLGSIEVFRYRWRQRKLPERSRQSDQDLSPLRKSRENPTPILNLFREDVMINSVGGKKQQRWKTQDWLDTEFRSLTPPRLILSQSATARCRLSLSGLSNKPMSQATPLSCVLLLEPLAEEPVDSWRVRFLRHFLRGPRSCVLAVGLSSPPKNVSYNPVVRPTMGP